MPSCIAPASPCHDLTLLSRGFDYGVVGWFWLIVAVEQQRAALGAPGNPVVHTPESDHFNEFVMLDERPEKSRVRVGQPLVGVIHQAALGGRNVAGDVGPGIALAA